MKKQNEKIIGTIVLGITASIAAYRMCDLILDLRKEGVRILPILSKDAQSCVAKGTGVALNHLDLYKKSIIAKR